jgi:hypothetical protein
VASRGLGLNLSFDLIIFVMGGSWQPAIKSKRNPNFRELTQSVQRWGENRQYFLHFKIFVTFDFYINFNYLFYLKKLKFEKIKYNFKSFK